jgi:hypothetical protein
VLAVKGSGGAPSRAGTWRRGPTCLPTRKSINGCRTSP